MAKRSLALGQVYRHLEPGPVVLLTTAHKNKINVMPLSWLTMFEFEPPLVGLICAESNFSFSLLTASKECVINVPTQKLIRQVVQCGNSTGKDFDKFEKFGLTAKESSLVLPPRVEECYASFEAKVTDKSLIKKYNFFIVEVVKAWIDPLEKNPRTLHHRGKGKFVTDGRAFMTSSKAR